MAYNAIRLEKGKAGWGGPLVIKPDEKRNVVLSVTGGGIDPVSQRIAELSGARVVDGFATTVADEEVFVAVVDCGGTARCGVYPKKGVYTVNLTPVGQSGPLAQYIKEDIYVSGVKVENVTLADEGATVSQAAKATEDAPKAAASAAAGNQKKSGLIVRLGKSVGGVVNKFFSAGKQTVQMVINNILPFMAFVSMLIGIISESGIGNIIAQAIAPISGSLIGLLIVCIVCALPFLSPILGPGAVIAQVVGVFLGVEIGKGNIPPQYALPALFAINPQVGCDFVPVGLSLGEATPETVEIGVPAVLFSRLITGPISVVIAFLFSFGLF
ncbi:PTS glucitol/sorbitol transporter subunit IIB [Alkalibacter rhizosphaerae]|uniref:PTS glucitol/sorbitol transporter subunit IIB n=1 Tax=Alkalibacter rhizosphaerae TaxID=2815577 RepID=A0A974XHU3_9FIRM|nr:PTS glucitol/sorbitol transporter subunit IIB [Alkalibacter rhizosphaerae]QSX08945.1 PTS glucitol/sorbitol transporter subunit IIB [Alkalibacter rhizosphaerae]